MYKYKKATFILINQKHIQGNRWIFYKNFNEECMQFPVKLWSNCTKMQTKLLLFWTVKYYNYCFLWQALLRLLKTFSNDIRTNHSDITELYWSAHQLRNICGGKRNSVKIRHESQELNFQMDIFLRNFLLFF